MNLRKHQKEEPFRSPRIRLSILRRFYAFSLQEGYGGDIEEEYGLICKRSGNQKAQIWMWRQVILSFPVFINTYLKWSMDMFKNYFIAAFRRMKKQALFTAITIAGLSIGMAVAILIMLHVQDEMAYDRFHRNAGEIYRINCEDFSGGGNFSFAGAPAPLGQALKDQVPEVIQFTRVQCGWRNWQIRVGDEFFMDEVLAAVDPAFFEIFDFPFVKGDPKTALIDPYSVVLTEELARKIFKDEDPMGKTVHVASRDLTVTGIIRAIPRHSHLQFTFAFPAENMRVFRESALDSWTYTQFATYIQTSKGVNEKDLNRKIMDITKQHVPEMNARLYLQPLRKIHLESSHINTWMVVYPNKGNLTLVLIFSLAAFCILLLACINFMNLSTAHQSTRAKEVGMRKVVGAGRADLVRQFLGESAILTAIALCIAVLLAWMNVPLLNQLAGKEMDLALIANWRNILGLLGIALFTGLVSGSYPAGLLSKFRPVNVLKAGRMDGYRKGLLRKILVVLQFSITTIILFCTSVLYLQLRYMQGRDLGYDTENIISFSGWGRFDEDYEAIKSELLQNPAIKAICHGAPPAGGEWGTTQTDWEGKTPDQEVKVTGIIADYDFLNVFGIKLAEGRFFSRDFSEEENYVLNETAVRAMGMKDPIGKWFSMNGRKGRIVGVVKDYHSASLHSPIHPVAFKYGHFFICVKFQTRNITELVQFLEKKWNETLPGLRFRYAFYDEGIRNWYKTEKVIVSMLRVFTLVAIVIAALGLFGLASFMTARRTKEIGVRKVLGANAMTIHFLLIRSFLQWILLANIIAWPIGHTIMKGVLQRFAYRIPMPVLVFFLTLGMALLIAMISVALQCWKASRANPIEALRFE